MYESVYRTQHSLEDIKCPINAHEDDGMILKIRDHVMSECDMHECDPTLVYLFSTTLTKTRIVEFYFAAQQHVMTT